MAQSFEIDGRKISPSHPPFVIAEMSGNHDGDIARAKTLIERAAAAGADAVKLQTYTPDTITIRSDRPEFKIDEGLWAGRTLHELYGEAHTPWDWHAPLFAHARALGITIFSSPFDPTAVDLLEELGAPAYKIASPEIIDWGLLEKVAETGKPIIVSTGMASDEEIGEALDVLRRHGAEHIVVLHCISAYPTPIGEANLSRISTLAGKFAVAGGLSDHTLGTVAPVVATTLGAQVIEKHFTLKRSDGGVDAAFSLEADELADMCRAVKDAFSAVGSGAASTSEAEKITHKFRRSLYFVADLAEGDVIEPAHVRSIRPGLGLAPKHLDALIGKRTTRAISYGTPTAWELVA
ncbi:MAG: pseudaminic acid synthase [Pseudomonadota bacterium]